jgi:hypothetical protein
MAKQSTGNGQFTQLLAPGRIGSTEVRNRVLMCPMGDNLAGENGCVTDRELAKQNEVYGLARFSNRADRARREGLGVKCIAAVLATEES